MIIVLLLIICSSATAKLIDVNTTQILVADTNANDPLKIRQAFAQIIAINTGEDIITILQNPVFLEAQIKSAIKRSYFEKIDTQYLPIQGEVQYWFHLVVQQNFIHKIILQAGFSLLPHNREEIMLWLVSEDDTALNPTAAEVEGTFKAQGLNYAYRDEIAMYWLQQWAQALGLIIKLPKMDETDWQNVSAQSIKSLSFEAAAHTQNRYQINKNLLVYIKKTELAVKIRSGFSLNQDDIKIKHFQQPTNEMGVILYSMMLDTSQEYALNYKIDSTKLQNHTQRIVITNLQNYDEVEKVRHYLNNLSVISSYNIVSAMYGTIEMNAELMINSEAFLKMTTRDKILSHDPSSQSNQLLFNFNTP